MSKKVALLGIHHESNTFVSRRTTLDDFRNGHWLTGESIRKEYELAHHEIGGMIETLDAHGIDTAFVMFAEATPGGTVTSGAFDYLLKDMMDELEKVLPVDGCLVVPHGAAVSESFPDMDGRWLAVLRARLGDSIPIVGTLDPHANVSALMASSTDALVAYSTNPHVDQRETGIKAANILVRILNGEINPFQLLVQAPVAISIEQQYTAAHPCRSLYEVAAQSEKLEGILSVSILLGFPYADVTEMGSSFIVISNNSPELSRRECQKLNAELIRRREDFVGDNTDIDAILPSIETMARPVLLLDMGDNVGGGSPGDSTYLLDAIESDGRYKCFIIIFDPQAVAEAGAFAEYEKSELAFGDRSYTQLPRKHPNTVQLLKKAAGKFSELSPRHGGQVNFDMGNIAIVETKAGNVVMLTSLRVPPFSLHQITTFGIEPADFDVIIAKGVNAPVAAYSPVCKTIIQVNTPGVTTADMTSLKYVNRRKPLFPFEVN